MARKRKPLEINGATVDLNAPGLQLVERLGGVIQQYWVASPDARRRGYQPRTVRLHYDLAAPAGRADLERRCAVLTNEMLAWLGDPEGQGRPVYDGTIAALIKCYQTDARSPYKVSSATPSAAMTTGAGRWRERSASGASTALAARTCGIASFHCWSRPILAALHGCGWRKPASAR
jgi:hypothetical protein